MKLSYLWRGLPGHPIHPPLTDATIGAYTFAMIAAFIQVVGITSHAGAFGWWLALCVGAITSLATVLTGFLEWLTITPGIAIGEAGGLAFQSYRSGDRSSLDAIACSQVIDWPV